MLEKLYKNKKTRDIAILVACISTIISTSIFSNEEVRNYFDTYIEYSIHDLTLDNLKKLIYSSESLTKDEKDYLYNTNFLNDLINTVNNSVYLKNNLCNHLTNMNIESFVEEGNLNGYYKDITPNIMYIKNYDESLNYDTLAHEFIHLCQNIGAYNLIDEACAEIISNEYFDNTVYDAYTEQVRLVKKLMEIIGPKPIWIYSFTGDFSLIEFNIRPYLSDEEYSEFLSCLVFDYDDYTLNTTKFETLDSLLNEIYKRKYNKDISDDEIISILDSNINLLQRYYFNLELINQDNSYYLDYENGSYEDMDLQTALDKKLIFIFAIKTTPITMDEAIELMDDDSITLSRTINCSSSNLVLTRTVTHGGKMYISGIINGNEINEVDVDELVKRGLLIVDYAIYDRKQLTAEEYFNHDYDEEAELYILHDPSTTFNENIVNAFVPKIVYIPTITESLNKRQQNSLILKNNL